MEGTFGVVGIEELGDIVGRDKAGHQGSTRASRNGQNCGGRGEDEREGDEKLHYRYLTKERRTAVKIQSEERSFSRSQVI